MLWYFGRSYRPFAALIQRLCRSTIFWGRIRARRTSDSRTAYRDRKRTLKYFFVVADVTSSVVLPHVANDIEGNVV